MLDIELKNNENIDDDFIKGIEESYKNSSLELFENKFFVFRTGGKNVDKSLMKFLLLMIR